MFRYKVVLLIGVLFYPIWIKACMSAYQFKIFPVGISHHKMITVDVQLFRSDAANTGNHTVLMIPAWLICTFIAEYNEQQRLINRLAVDTFRVTGDTYKATLQKGYSLAYQRILKRYAALELLVPEYISYCDFQKNCSLVSVRHTQLLYQQKKYRLSILGDSAYYGFSGRYSPSSRADAFFISSVRVYRAGAKKLLMVHLGTGHEVSMGWIVEDWKSRSKKDEEIWIPKEERPPFPFRELKTAVYQEPLLHHGFGFDVFILN